MALLGQKNRHTRMPVSKKYKKMKYMLFECYSHSSMVDDKDYGSVQRI